MPGFSGYSLQPRQPGAFIGAVEQVLEQIFQRGRLPDSLQRRGTLAGGSFTEFGISSALIRL